jgi:hypothetical protein
MVGGAIAAVPERLPTPPSSTLPPPAVGSGPGSACGGEGGLLLLANSETADSDDSSRNPASAARATSVCLSCPKRLCIILIVRERRPHITQGNPSQSSS